MSTFPDESAMRAGPGGVPGDLHAAAASPPTSRLPLAGGVLFAVVAEAILLLSLKLSAGTHLELVEIGVPLMSGLFALGSCLLVSVALPGRERSAWLLMGLACLGILIAQITRIFPLVTGKSLLALQGESYPSLAAVALIAQSLGFFLAFLLFPPPARSGSTVARLGQFFDGVLVVGAALVAVIYFVLVPLAELSIGPMTAAQVTTLLMCVGDLLLLGGLTFALRSLSQRDRALYRGLSILGLAMLLLVGADFASMVLTPNRLAPTNSLLQAFWNAGYLAMGLGALLRLNHGSQMPDAQEAPGASGIWSSVWRALPFTVTMVVAGSIVIHAFQHAHTLTELLVALICSGLLVALVGVRHLVGLLEMRQMNEQRQQAEREVALAQERIEQFQASQLAQAHARRESLEYALDTIRRFGYGDYQARVGALERELLPLGEHLNILLDGMERQLNDRDRGREARLVYILTDALGRLALGELHDLPELPAPAGSPLDGLMMSVVQVRARLIGLQGTVQQYEEGHFAAQQELERARQELEYESHSQRQAVQEMTQTLEGQLYSERQVAQATEEQWQRERQRLQTQAQAAETRAVEMEAMLHAAEQRLVTERMESEQRLKAAQQQLAERAEVSPGVESAQLAGVRQRGQRLAGQFVAQAERLHGAAATLQTAASVAERLARTIQETAALPELQGTSQPELEAVQPPAPQPAEASASAQPMSALQMLERLASGRVTDTRPKMPAVTAASASNGGMPPARSTTGPLDESANERVARRLRVAATRAEEIANGLLELAQQCIQAGDESVRAAEEAEHLTADAEPPKVSGLLRVPKLPARAPRGGR